MKMLNLIQMAVDPSENLHAFSYYQNNRLHKEIILLPTIVTATNCYIGTATKLNKSQHVKNWGQLPEFKKFKLFQLLPWTILVTSDRFCSNVAKYCALNTNHMFFFVKSYFNFQYQQ